MKRMTFKRPTNHYDEKVKFIDEQICKLINERKELSENNPGYPPFEYISNWAEEFGLYENMLKSIFASMWNEKSYKPMIEPEGFQKNLQVLKSIEISSKLFSVVYIAQYSNCSLINLDIDRDSYNTAAEEHRHSYFKLFIGSQYDCSMLDGGGGNGHLHYNFVVSPALPDNFFGTKLTFKEFSYSSMDNQIGDDIIIQL